MKRLVVPAAILIAVLPTFLAGYYLELVIQIAILALFAMSLDLLIGYTGLASLGHAAYFGVAAYATGLLTLDLGWPAYLSLPASLLVAALTAALFGLLALRARGSYFLMITLALSQVLWGIASGWRDLTNGDDGLANIPRPHLFTATIPFYYFAIVIAAIGMFLLVRLVQSPFGIALRGIRESETRMRALGYNVWRIKYAAFIAAGTFAGLAGALYAYLNNFVSPDALYVVRSAEVLLMVILGGAGTLIGPAIGTAIIVALQNLISAYTERWVMILGIIYVIVALFAPTGLVGLYQTARKRWAPP